MSQAPERIWIDAWGGNWSPVSGGTQEIEYIRKDAACVEVKEGYRIEACFIGENTGQWYPGTLTGALTIRTVEDVRREALEEAAEICSHWEGVFEEIKSETSSAYGAATCEREIRALIDTPAPSRENVQPFEGWVDDKTYVQYEQSEPQHPDDDAVEQFAASMKAKLAKKRAEGRGGWEDKDQCPSGYLDRLLREHVEKGDPVDVANLAMMIHQRGERIEPQPTPSPEPVAWQVKDFARGWITFDSKFKALEYAEPVSAHVRPPLRHPARHPRVAGNGLG